MPSSAGRSRDLHIINAVVAQLPAGGARELASRPGVKAGSLNGAVKSQAGESLATSFNQSIQATEAWGGRGTDGTGKGIAVAVVDTGIAGDMRDFARRRRTAPRA